MKVIFTSHQNPIPHSRTWPARKLSVLTLYCFLVLTLISETGCVKNVPKNILPPVTQEGKNTFGCRVNGVNWTPYFHCGFMSGGCRELGFYVYNVDSVNKLPLGFRLIVERRNSDNTFSDFSFETYGLSPINQVGNIFDSLSIGYDKNEDHYQPGPAYQSYSSGAVNITKLDTVNKIMSGTFAFILYNSTGDSVVITDGRFDLTYNACLCY